MCKVCLRACVIRNFLNVIEMALLRAGWCVANELLLKTDKIHTEFRNFIASTSKDLIRELM